MTAPTSQRAVVFGLLLLLLLLMMRVAVGIVRAELL
jgi:hypothetical protein